MSLRTGQERHGCIASDVANWRTNLAANNDEELLERIRAWPEFDRPLGDNIRLWRVYCGMNRREAYRRGLKI